MKIQPSAPSARTDPHVRRRAVQRIFEEEGWGSLELIAEWNGEDLEELRRILRDVEYETLLDRLKDQADSRR